MLTITEPHTFVRCNCCVRRHRLDLRVRSLSQAALEDNSTPRSPCPTPAAHSSRRRLDLPRSVPFAPQPTTPPCRRYIPINNCT